MNQAQHSTGPSPHAVEATELMARQAAGESIFFLDCRFDLSNPDAGRQAHEASRPVGARYAHLDDDLAASPQATSTDPAFPGRHPLPDRHRWAERVGFWGVTPDTHVVTFDAHGSPYAARAWWMLRWLGHTRVQVLQGGWPAWVAAGGAQAQGPLPGPQPQAAYPATPLPSMPTVDAASVAQHLGTYVVVDARAPDRFRGENETLDPAAGHIPGALNHCFRDNLDAEGRFKPAEALRRLWGDRLGGVSWQGAPHPDDHVWRTDIVQQCGSGVTACQNILALMLAGGPVTSLYVGSWSEWSADPNRPRAVGGD